jgi:hypothetical protein
MIVGKPTALHDVSVFFLGFLSRDLPVSYLDETTIALISILFHLIFNKSPYLPHRTV